jgi:site-specific recombinase XerD
VNRKDALYPHLEKRLEKDKKRIENAQISQVNREHLKAFLVKLEADGVSKPQIISYVDRLLPIAKILGDTDFKQATKRDMEGVFAQLRRGYIPRGKDKKAMRPYKQSSMNKCMECVKSFYRWLHDLSSTDPAPDAVRWLRSQKASNSIRAEDLWTEQDIETVMKTAKYLRDKAMLSVLYECGLRPGELRGLKMKDVHINGDMVRLYVAGKTEKKLGERMVPAVRSYHLLRTWVSQHPGRDNPEAWLWSFGDEPIKEITVRFLVQRLVNKAKIKKPGNPYILRHTALTRFYKKLSGSVASKLAGHAPGSKEAETYCHLSADDMDNSVRELNGLERKEIHEFTKCVKCGQSLGVGDKLCPMCGLAQDQEVALKQAENVDQAVLLKAGLEALSRKYPELDKLITPLLNRELEGMLKGA